jgi:CRISPR-associated protein Cmr6
MIAGVTVEGHDILRRTTQNLYQQFYQFADPWMKDDGKKAGLKDIVEKSRTLGSVLNPILDSFHNRQDGIRGVRRLKVRSVSRLSLGTGLPNLFEVGIQLHPQYGVPYVPASSVRGAVRSFCKSRKAYDDIEIRRLFGNEPEEDGEAGLQRGAIRFLDMLPAVMPYFELDLVNPHFQKYYQGDQPPRANQDPIPVFFLTVAESAGFVVRYVSEAEVPENFDRLIALTLMENGLGAKTALGYGRFILDEPKTQAVAHDGAVSTVAVPVSPKAMNNIDPARVKQGDELQAVVKATGSASKVEIPFSNGVTLTSDSAKMDPDNYTIGQVVKVQITNYVKEKRRILMVKVVSL